ncbi:MULTISPECIES: hypothetical protein [unclassified Bradyrhizobium]|uniref:hypothetical protein n=1 Tax=unclassified Bradyrhizobium TaxID=2631580 RepID=UPI0028E6CEAF|nr:MULTISPECIES: hypothetical protein [unclassified Bradyrhizobium]
MTTDVLAELSGFLSPASDPSARGIFPSGHNRHKAGEDHIASQQADRGCAEDEARIGKPRIFS